VNAPPSLPPTIHLHRRRVLHVLSAIPIAVGGDQGLTIEGDRNRPDRDHQVSCHSCHPSHTYRPCSCPSSYRGGPQPLPPPILLRSEHAMGWSSALPIAAAERPPPRNWRHPTYSLTPPLHPLAPGIARSAPQCRALASTSEPKPCCHLANVQRMHIISVCLHYGKII